MNVWDYIAEEVSRQGHNVFALDGLERIGWMMDAWCHAISEPLPKRGPTMSDIEHLGKMVERYKNGEGFRSCGVRVGPRVYPPWQDVVPQLKNLLKRWDELSPIEFYKKFELIHPFVDGNGRTGKILLNWKNGTLLDPIFPPSDLFGEPILNP
jgi:hypothetical protein